MRLLLSNDDGYSAPGLTSLARGLQRFADVTIVAPDKNRSGASNSLTLEQPLRATQVSDHVIKVDGTPTDCVHLAITGLLEDEPDMVFSGINHGANLGDDVLYSGTVAAATEGRFLGLPAVAISHASHDADDFEAAVQVAIDIFKQLQHQPLPQDTILNINVPDLPLADIKGYQSTRLGQRHKAEAMIKAYDPRGRAVYWVGAAGPEQDAGPGTDFYAISQGYVSVTPLKVDLTHHDAITELSSWLPQRVSL
ncbi:MAG: 5'/3'-nucleotidase SurE [Gammaproteobacteria bacterium]|nr:5'/3'-nucleotidase SurE [Gammaproteobacteria bacterium]